MNMKIVLLSVANAFIILWKALADKNEKMCELLDLICNVRVKIHTYQYYCLLYALTIPPFF